MEAVVCCQRSSVKPRTVYASFVQQSISRLAEGAEFVAQPRTFLSHSEAPQRRKSL